MNQADFGTINEGLVRRYGGDRPGPIFTFGSDAFPVIQISDSLMDPEIHWLAGSRLCAGSVGIGGNPGNQGGIGLENPANSGAIAVLDRTEILSGTAGPIYVTMQPAAAFLGSAAGYFRDRRGQVGANPMRTTCIIGQNLAAFSPTLSQLTLVANTMLVHDVSYVLTPGGRITFATEVVNRGLLVAFYWRERKMNLWETSI